MKSISLVRIFSFLVFIFISDTLVSQSWKSMDDSTYNFIVSQRFNKGNILAGMGGTLKIGHGNESYVSFGLRPQSGYFIFNKFLLFVNVNYFIGNTNIKDEDKKVIYNRLFYGINARYYLKPKARAFFFQIGPFFGKQALNNGGFTEVENFNETAIGLNAAAGLSIFVKRFEVELLAGLAYSFTQTSNYNNAAGANILQINLSYILQRKNR